MNSKSTWRLFFAAVTVFAFIYFFERKGPNTGPGAKPLLVGQLDPLSVTAVELRMTNQMIRAERTNDTWRLTTPFYPAQSTPIETFLTALAQLRRHEVISASDVAAQPRKLKDFGLEQPAATLTINQGSNRFLLNLGSRTPLLDQLYVQIAGSPEVVVTDGSILKALPASANDWRSPMLLSLSGRPFDHVQIRAGQRQVEFALNATNSIWRINKPTPARANNPRITLLLQQLTAARVKEFVTDSPAADLERFGLQTPELELSFLLGTNPITALEFGASPTNDPGNVYVRRPNTTNIVLVGRELLDALNQPPKAFHDPRLLSVKAAEISEIQVNGTNGFTVTIQTNGAWKITEPTPMAADRDLMNIFITNLLRMEIVDFAKDVPTDADLKEFGLVTPRFTVALFSARTNATGVATNALVTQVDVGGNKSDDTVYTRRSDETPVYVTPFGDVFDLPRAGWQVRDRRIFNFEPKQVTTIYLSAEGKTNQLTRQPTGWIADNIKNAEIEEALYRLGQLQARNWVLKGSENMAALGVTPASLTISAEVTRDGKVEPATVTFGRRSVRSVYAATILPGETEPTAFELSTELYQQLLTAFGIQP